jgi:cell volume regulation protein A
MHDVTHFGLIVLVTAGAFAAVLVTSRISARTSVPSAAFFLVAAALLSDALPALALSTQTVERVATLALIVILFDGGSSIGWRRFRAAATPIAMLGTVGTFATAGLTALFAHWALGLAWLPAGLLGAAVAPTDPAVMFSVLGDQEVAGRTDTILEGESGANDPVGIALVIGLLELTTHSGAGFWIVVRTFLEQMAIGLAIGVGGGLAETQLMRRVTLPSSGLWLVQTMAGAGVVYGLATVAHGSGFLAVFIAGLVVGDVRAPFKTEIELVQEVLSSVAEVVVFVALGLTVALSSISATRWAEGVAIAAFVALVARPLAVGPLLLPADLTRGERLFVIWGGLKGAVPILLASFVVAAHADDAQRLYELVFVVVLASVVVQGSSIPAAARRCGIEMRRARTKRADRGALRSSEERRTDP